MYNKLDQVKEELSRFYVVFMDQDRFKSFFDSIQNRPDYDDPIHFKQQENIDVAGYFSESAVNSLCSLLSYSKIRLLSPEIRPKSSAQDRRNLRSLRKMQDKGIEIKIHKRLHARFLVTYKITGPTIYNRQGITIYEISPFGQLLLGSFDFNKEGILGERRDIGILTEHPDLVEAAVRYFDELWNEDSETSKLDEEYPQ
jgi:hypothetical protein